MMGFLHISSSGGAPDVHELAFRRRTLRDATICIACVKLVSVICYTGLYFLVYLNTEGQWSTVFQVMTLTAVVLQSLLGIVLFVGSLQCNSCALSLGMWLSLITASFNTVMGAMGAMYYIRTGHYTVHFLLACLFAALTCSICVTLCHDMIIIYSFMKSLKSNYGSDPAFEAYHVQTRTELKKSDGLRIADKKRTNLPAVANTDLVLNIFNTESQNLPAVTKSLTIENFDFEANVAKENSGLTATDTGNLENSGSTVTDTGNLNKHLPESVFEKTKTDHRNGQR